MSLHAVPVCSTVRQDGARAQSSVVLLRTYLMAGICPLKEKAWQFVTCLSLAQALATVPLWGTAPRILGRLDHGRIRRALVSQKLELVLLFGLLEVLVHQ